MKAEIICIGTELLLGQIVNTNQSFLSQRLAGLGINSYYHTTVGDNPRRLADTLKTSLSRSDIVITTGGLGPTVDDITLETIAMVTGKKLTLKTSILKKIKGHFKKRNIIMPPENTRQAYLPQGAIELPNAVGTAPGFMLKTGKKILIAVPGPPREMQGMIDKYAIPYLKKHYPTGNIIKTRAIRITGLAESQVNTKVKSLLRLSGSTTLGIYAKPSIIDLKITARASGERQADRSIKPVARKIQKIFGDKIFGYDQDSLESVVGKLLRGRRKTLSIAESCTGGLICDMITDIPGSSDYFLQGAVSYSNASKIKILGVSTDIIKKYGAVSAKAALEMAKGMRKASGAYYSLSTTGIAGPSGATKTKPVGLVYIGLSTPAGTTVKRYNFVGERKIIKLRAAIAALDLLRRELIGARA